MFTLVSEGNESKYIIYKDFEKNIKDKKNCIDKHVKIWNKIKKISNPYELIHNINKNNYKPISRSYYKMLEMITDYNLLDSDNNRVACLAEGPGGFIEAIYNYSNINKKQVKIYGVTLPPDNESDIPKWNSLKINDFINTKIIYGDLCNKNDITGFMNYINTKVDFVTADGAVDYSADYNKQEQLSYKLFLGEILTAFMILKKGGTYVMKVFDTFRIVTIKILGLLYEYFDEFTICKPKTSRVLNSEKYVILKGFKGIDTIKLDKLLNLLKELDENTLDLNITKLRNDFIHIINKYNIKFYKQQLDYLDIALKNANNFLKFDKSEIIINQKKLAMEWHSIYGI